jgi:hypothetical protein
MIIHDALQAGLTNQPKRRIDKTLWVSDLGRNPYGALKRLLTGETEPFDYQTMLKMDGGSALELSTLRHIAENIGRKVNTQMPLWNDIWSGYADLVIGHGSDNVIIYDHKGSAGKWWDYKDSLPRAADCLQVWMYGELYHQTYGIQPQLGLFYRGWESWGEFDISVIEDNAIGHVLQAFGQITDEKGQIIKNVSRIRRVNPYWLQTNMQSYYGQIMDGDLTIEMVERMAPDGPDWDWAEQWCSGQADHIPF